MISIGSQQNPVQSSWYDCPVHYIGYDKDKLICNQNRLGQQMLYPREPYPYVENFCSLCVTCKTS